MQIDSTEITITQSSIFSLEPTDSVKHCLIKVQKSKLGVEHPIRIQSRATFQDNYIRSEIPAPILCDTSLGNDFLKVGDNYFESLPQKAKERRMQETSVQKGKKRR